MPIANFKYHSASTGKTADGVLKLEDYGVAERNGIRVTQLLNEKFSDADPRFGTAFEQGMRSLGIYTKADTTYGNSVSTVRELMTGECMYKQSAVQMSTGSSPSGGGTIVSPGGPVGGDTPASRVFFPAVVLAMIEENLRSDYSPEMAAFRKMLAVDSTIQSEVWTQPIINSSAPGEVRRRGIAQNALPRNMVSIETSQTSHAMLTSSVGLQISEQAQSNTTIDIVSLIVAEQIEGQMKADLWEDIGNVVSGNIDAGQSALTPVLGSTFDSGFTGGAVTNTGFVKLLNDPTRRVSIDSIFCTLDDVLAIQGRTGRPLIFDPKTTGANLGNVGTAAYTVEPVVLNFSTAVPNVLIVPAGTFSAQHLVCFDSRYGLRRITNAAASYSATEKMVLQRSDNFRWDFGSQTHRLRDEAFLVCDYS